MNVLARLGDAFLRGWDWWNERHRGWRPITMALGVVCIVCACWSIATMPATPDAVRWTWDAASIAWIGLGFVHAPRSLRKWKWRKRQEKSS